MVQAATKQYLIVTANYWAFTLTDGALRMLVVLFFHDLGYSPLAIAMLFIFYEVFGVITNLVGGWLGSRIGLNRTMNIGLLLQIIALGMLLVPAAMLTVPWVMAAQALSGIAKDLNKMSAKSAVKSLLPEDAHSRLFRWVAILTGSKNTLKGVGFFLGGALLSLLGFNHAILAMAVALAIVWLYSLVALRHAIGKSKNKPKFTQIFSKSKNINRLSAARMFLFGARDVWFVVALPVYLATVFGWEYWTVGGFLALWIIGYGVVQGSAPFLLKRADGMAPDGRAALGWAILLGLVTAGIALLLQLGFHPQTVLIAGLLVFGAVFAVNSSVHSFLIVSYADSEHTSLDVGFYYMANAMGRLIGTVLSGWLYQSSGLVACLWVSALFIGLAAAFSILLPRREGED